MRVFWTDLAIDDPAQWLTTDKPWIGVLWHTWASLAIELAWRTNGGRRAVWLNLLDVKMGPTHELCECFAKVEMALTASPRDSIAVVADMLKTGECLRTIVMPDGPSGPLHSFRKGCLHMALQSGAPLVPIRVQSEGMLAMSTWDRKRIPTPLGRARFELGPAVSVSSKGDFEAAQAHLVKYMT